MFAMLGMLGMSNVTAQTADEIIAKYVETIGGKEKLTGITSLYTEGKMEVMGMEGLMKITVLNGKGMRQDMEIMGSTMTTCINDKDGWSINPMTGSTSAEPIPDAQYKAAKDQIFVGEPFLNYAAKGYKVELLGNEAVAGADAYKIKMTSPDETAVTYYFDAATYLLVKTIQQADMQGQMVENETIYSDYQDTDGILQPHKMEMSMAGGQFLMTANITKIEVNKPVEEAFFAKP